MLVTAPSLVAPAPSQIQPAFAQQTAQKGAERSAAAKPELGTAAVTQVRTMAKAALGIANPKDAIPAIPSDPPALKGLGVPALALSKAIEREQEAPIFPDPPERLGSTRETAEADVKAREVPGQSEPASETDTAPETALAEGAAAPTDDRDDAAPEDGIAEFKAPDLDTPELATPGDTPPAADTSALPADTPAETAEPAARDEAEPARQVSTVRDDYLVALRVPAQSGVDVRV